MTLRARKRALELIESGEHVCDVADQLGVSRQALWKCRQANEEFAEAWEEAAETGRMVQVSELEKEADFRGRIGWLEPRFFEGRICGYVVKYSDALLMARLKALAPEKYSDRAEHKHEHSGPKGGPIPHAVEIDWIGVGSEEGEHDAGGEDPPAEVPETP